MQLQIDLLIKLANLVRCLKAQRMKQFGCAIRVHKEGKVKRIKEWRPTAVKKKPVDRGQDGEDDIREDVLNMKIQTCSRMVGDREAWKRVVERVKTHEEL